MGRSSGIPGVSIYKPKARCKPNHKWLIHYVEDGHDRVESVSTELAATRRFANLVSQRLERMRLGLVSPDEARWMEQAKRPLADHLADYKQALIDRGNTAKHARLFHNRLIHLAGKIGATLIAHLTPAAVQSAVGALPVGNSTRNHYLLAATCFYKWMHTDRRVPRNELSAALKGYNAKTDCRRRRRIITEQELERLIHAAEAGLDYVPDRCVSRTVSGSLRALIYSTAVATALRANELRTLTVGRLRLKEEPPGILVEARFAKNRRESFQIIGIELAMLLRRHVVGKAADEPVFGKLPHRLADMLRFDLAAAKIPYETDEGVFDFHSLRHESGSLMVARGANLKVVQAHMRHSSITMTMDRYAKPQLHDQVAAANSIPTFAAQDIEPQTQRATGTTDALPFQRTAQRTTFPLVPRRTLPDPLTKDTNPDTIKTLSLRTLGIAEEASEPAQGPDARIRPPRPPSRSMLSRVRRGHFCCRVRIKRLSAAAHSRLGLPPFSLHRRSCRGGFTRFGV